MTQSTTRNKLALQQIYGKLNQDQGSLGIAVAAYKRIAESPLFDATYYQTRYPDADSLGMEPLAHYVLHGSGEGRSTHPLFDGHYYRRAALEKNLRVRNFLRHYLELGAAEGVQPNLLFDHEYYASQVGLVEGNPLEHFLNSGGTDANPFPLFDSRYYLKENSDVKLAGINPLTHFLVLGAYEGRSPHPLFHSEYYLRKLGMEPLSRFALSDPEKLIERIYKHAFANIWDADAPGIVNPLLHYLELGASEERNPHPLFSTKYYSERYPENAGNGVNPLVHYVLRGERELRQPHLLFDPTFYLSQLGDEQDAAAKAPLTHYCMQAQPQLLAPHPSFDPVIYHELYTRMEGGEPLFHYLSVPEDLERRVPNGWLDGEFYASFYADVTETGLTPLEHYIRYGINETRARNFLDLARKAGIKHGFVEDPVRLEDIQFHSIAEPDVSIVFHGSSRKDYTLRALGALSRHATKYSFELIVLTEEGGLDLGTLQKHGVKLLDGTNTNGQSQMCNQAIDLARGKYVIFLKQNMHVLNGWLDSLIAVFEDHETIGLVQSQILTPLGRIKSAGLRAESLGKVRRLHAYYDGFSSDLAHISEIEFGSRDSLAGSLDVLKTQGGFTSAIGSSIFEDADLAERMRNTARGSYCQPISRVVALGEYTRAANQYEPVSPEEVQAYERYLQAQSATSSRS